MVSDISVMYVSSAVAGVYDGKIIGEGELRVGLCLHAHLRCACVLFPQTCLTRDELHSLPPIHAGVPITSQYPYLFFRRDLFQRWNLTIPNTWKEFVELSVRMNGTGGWGGPGSLVSVLLQLLSAVVGAGDAGSG